MISRNMIRPANPSINFGKLAKGQNGDMYTYYPITQAQASAGISAGATGGLVATDYTAITSGSVVIGYNDPTFGFTPGSGNEASIVPTIPAGSSAGAAWFKLTTLSPV